jgi:murein DD-endopeptidase MepM/ murein hydrolase activator NlpD
LSYKRVLVSLLAAAPSAAVAAPAPVAADGGGAPAPGAPQAHSATCLDSPGAACSGRGLLRGRTFVVRGTQLGAVAKIVFRGGRGKRDDVSAGPVKRTGRYVVAVVPDRARSGALTLVDRWGNESTTGFRVGVRDAPKPKPLDLSPSSRFFYAGRRRPSFSVQGSGHVDLLSEGTGEIVRSWDVQAAPDQVGEVRWNGKGASGVGETGAYRFQLAGAATASATSGEDSRFFFGDHLFPIRGRHNLGWGATNGFGGGRGHQGQDMFAECGTRVGLARGGKVQFAGYHGAAGYYVVVDAAGTEIDHVYMHLRGAALVRTRERVFTGQKIGEVGDTGRATGCHLHFEMWTGPGWYEGGRPFDPLPSLKRWDGYS